ncbi:DUF948 domain-containing protein [Fervidibacillus halotolerans]|uniref:DUF948 domain-containing protein n=1 Tax=Fervidibacillus halotolerans TaxID=2980027 RepID=A0A9E8LXY9_9BACI|nr:DUF948 domain-containing protein [Fervidibacillus halotolerans]WAA11742.1 DUF948 domain-containing protein [Fervidibacillus halotolerans]
MDAILYASVALVAIAFTVLVVYLISTLKTLSKTLEQISKTLGQAETQLKEVTEEAGKLLKKTNALAEDIQEKSEKLNTVVNGVQEVGKTIYQFNDSLQSFSGNVKNELKKNEEKVVQIIQWADIVAELKEKMEEIRRRKKQKKIEKNNKL